MSPTWQLELHPEVAGTHQWSIFSGLAKLKSQGLIALKVTRLRPIEARASVTMTVTHLTTGSQRLVSFEMHDGADVDAWNADNADVIFKRSFAPSASLARQSKATMLPLGLTLGCLHGGAASIAASSTYRLAVDNIRGRRAVGSRRLLSSARSVLGGALTTSIWKSLDSPYIRVDDLEELRPQKLGEPYVTFLVRAWDPAAASEGSKAMFSDVTAARAVLIRCLRARFGDRFVGGFVSTAYTRRVYPDCVAQVSTSQRDFLRTVGHGGIGVSTKGLADSNPWKLAEYLALGAAIVTEPLTYVLPEPIGVGESVLVFENPDECVDSCQRLFDDPALRASMQRENQRYWSEYVRPEKLMLRRLNELRQLG